MANFNKVFLMGNLTKDPDLRYTPQNMPVTDLRLAVNREFTVKGTGEKRKDTLFIDVTVWSKQAEVCCQYLKKGSPIFIEGRLAMDSWEQDGQKRSRIRVVAENFQFIGGGRGASEPSTEADMGGRSGGDYGSGFRRQAPAPGPAEPIPEQVEDIGPPPHEETPF